MKEAFSKIPNDTFQHLGINAGMILSDFNWRNGTYNNADILGATTGGINFTATPEFTDFGEDIDNCPKNTKELKRVSDISVTCSGTFVAMNSNIAARLAAVADKYDLTAVSLRHHKIVPRDNIDVSNDFTDIWIVGDYSDKNTGSGAGFIAIHMMNVMNTSGFQIQTADKEKMQYAFEFTAHYSIDAQETVPYEIYVVDGQLSSTLTLDRKEAWLAVGDTLDLTAVYTAANGIVLKWSADQYPSTGSDDVVALDHAQTTGPVKTDTNVITASAKGHAIVSVYISGTILVDTCIVHVEAAS